MMRKFLLIAACVLCVGLIGTGLMREYAPLSWTDWIGWSVQDSPITMAVVIEEVKQADASRDTMFGVTVQALRKVDKWKQWDKDNVPTELKPLLEVAMKGQTDTARWQSWLFIIHDKRVTWNGPLPKTDAELAERIQSSGGK